MCTLDEIQRNQFENDFWAMLIEYEIIHTGAKHKPTMEWKRICMFYAWNDSQCHILMSRNARPWRQRLYQTNRIHFGGFRRDAYKHIKWVAYEIFTLTIQVEWQPQLTCLFNWTVVVVVVGVCVFSVSVQKDWRMLHSLTVLRLYFGFFFCIRCQCLNLKMKNEAIGFWASRIQISSLRKM